MQLVALPREGVAAAPEGLALPEREAAQRALQHARAGEKGGDALGTGLAFHRDHALCWREYEHERHGGGLQYHFWHEDATDREAALSRFGLNDSKYSTISRYVIATGIALVLVAYVGVHLAEIAQGIGAGCAWVFAILNPLIVGGLVACLLWPLVTRFDRLFAKVRPLSGADRTRHALAVVAVVLLTAGIVAAIVSVLLAFVTDSIRAVSPGNLSELVGYVSDSMSAAYDGVVRLATSLGGSRADVDEVVGSVVGVFTSGGGSIGARP